MLLRNVKEKLELLGVLRASSRRIFSFFGLENEIIEQGFILETMVSLGSLIQKQGPAKSHMVYCVFLQNQYLVSSFALRYRLLGACFH